jgi:Raf kinase inhibitor-like YbhB/YbcL family protein
MDGRPAQMGQERKQPMRLRKTACMTGLAAALALGACSTAKPDAADTAPAQPAAAEQLADIPPAETAATNRANYKPAFEGQTRAPELKANVEFDVQNVVASGLTNPFSFNFLPDGRYLIAEKANGLRVAAADGKLSPVVTGLPTYQAQGQGGLLDVVPDPAFATNNTIYWSYTEPQPDGTNNTAVAKAKLVDGAAPSVTDVKVIYRQAPSLKSPLHFGSRLVFARDGTLFVTLGERSIMEGRVQAQDLNSALGKIVRINTDGTIPKDNPFVGRADAKPEIWSYGHRNVQGAFLHPTTGELWDLEHGPQGGDEINIARKGKDYGWPTITYGIEYPPGSATIGEGLTQKEGMEQPIYYWDPVIAPGNMAYYNASLFPAWKDSVFASGLRGGYVARLTVKGERVVGEERLKFSDKPERYRDVRVGPDGALYVLTEGFAARLLRVVPKGAPLSVATPALRPAEAAAANLASATLPGANAGKLTVTTPAFKDGGDMDFQYTQYGANRFPGLEWTAGPAATKSYAIIMQDPDLSIRGFPVLHWSMANLPATTTSLPAGMKPEEKPAGSVYGPNYQGVDKPYLGPRTPPGFKDRYHFQVFALDVMLPADFAPKNYDELIAPMKGHVLATGKVVGLGRPDPNAPPPAPRPAAPAATGSAPKPN